MVKMYISLVKNDVVMLKTFEQEELSKEPGKLMTLYGRSTDPMVRFLYFSTDPMIQGE